MAGFPFAAVVGQSDIKTALLISAVAPEIGGVLIFGKRGTAKSTLVRALPEVLPLLEGVADCPYFCDPSQTRRLCRNCQARQQRGEVLPLATRRQRVITLPLNASEERLVGYFDLTSALKHGDARRFEPGLLAAANRNILYVDEVNLLADHLVDSLLDAASLGVNYVERDNVSEVHPARFLLVGTMNPEEGELRPQLLDRFGLAVQAETIRNVPSRSLIIERALIHQSDPAQLTAEVAGETADLLQKLTLAIEYYPQVKTPPKLRYAIAKAVSQEMQAAGHRGDIVVNIAARAIAALDGRLEVTLDDANLALRLAMSHRARSFSSLQKALMGVAQEEDLQGGESPEEATEIAQIDDYPEPEAVPDEDYKPGMAGISRKIKEGLEGFPLKAILDFPRDRQTRQYSGRRFESLSSRRSGRYIRSRYQSEVNDLALDATLRAAAVHQKTRGWIPGQRLELREPDFRQKVRQRKSRALLVFAIDASDSVMSRQLMNATKRAILALMQDAYEKRDRVAILTFRFASARLLLPPTNNYTQAREALEQIYVGGCTPIATGIQESLKLIEKEQRRDRTIYPALLLFTDGLANVGLSGKMNEPYPVQDALRMCDEIAQARIATTVIDTGPHFHPGVMRKSEEGICREMAERMNGNYYILSDLKGNNIFEEAEA